MNSETPATTDPVERLIDTWTRRAARLDGYGLVIEANQAKAIGQCIRDLRRALGEHRRA